MLMLAIGLGRYMYTHVHNMILVVTQCIYQKKHGLPS